MPSFKGKIAILPCTGAGQILGTITRQATYRVVDDLRKDKTVLLCLPALVRGVKEDLDMVRDCPVVVIDGCKDRCGAHSLSLQKGKSAATIFVPDVLKGQQLQIKNENRHKPLKEEEKAIELVATLVAEEVDRLLKNL